MDGKVDWRDSKPKLVDQLLLMYKNGIRTDLTINVSNGQKHQCHKIIAMRLSSLFETMIFDVAYDEGCINISAAHPDHFFKIIEYAYSDRLNLESATEALNILSLSEQYEIKQVEKLVMAYLFNNVNCSSVWKILDLPNNKSANLTNKVGQFIELNAEECLESDDFLKCSQSALNFLLSKPRLNIKSESQVVLAVIRWCQYQLSGSTLVPEEAKSLLGPCLKQIRFLSLSPAEFSNHVYNSGLLSKDDCLAIMVNLSAPGQDKLPDYICSIQEPRKTQQKMPEAPITHCQGEEKPSMESTGAKPRTFKGRTEKKGKSNEHNKKFAPKDSFKESGKFSKSISDLSTKGPELKVLSTYSSKKNVNGLVVLVAVAEFSLSERWCYKSMDICYQQNQSMHNSVDLQVTFAETNNGPQKYCFNFNKGPGDLSSKIEFKNTVCFDGGKLYALIFQLACPKHVASKDLEIVRLSQFGGKFTAVVNI